MFSSTDRQAIRQGVCGGAGSELTVLPGVQVGGRALGHHTDNPGIQAEGVPGADYADNA